MKKIAIIGYYKSGAAVNGGQGIKTAILTTEIENSVGKENVKKVDTDNWKKHAIMLGIQCLYAVLSYKNVLFLTDENGIRVFPKLLEFINFTRRSRIHYYVVGGWLTDYIKHNRKATKYLKKLDAIYVEIPSMKDELVNKGFSNVILVNKFRRLIPASSAEIDLYPKEPYKLCFFARVMKEKGIEDAIATVIEANRRAGRNKFSLDIFGAIDEGYAERFSVKQKEFPDFIQYKGIVDFKKSTDVLKMYFAMLFPTFYKSEGYPNTIVDSFAAGLPIIATRWNYNAEIINDYKDGILVEVGNIEQYIGALNELADNTELYAKMRINCLDRCKEYLPENAVIKVLKELA